MTSQGSLTSAKTGEPVLAGCTHEGPRGRIKLDSVL